MKQLLVGPDHDDSAETTLRVISTFLPHNPKALHRTLSVVRTALTPLSLVTHVQQVLSPSGRHSVCV